MPADRRHVEGKHVTRVIIQQPATARVESVVRILGQHICELDAQLESVAELDRVPARSLVHCENASPPPCSHRTRAQPAHLRFSLSLAFTPLNKSHSSVRQCVMLLCSFCRAHGTADMLSDPSDARSWRRLSALSPDRCAAGLRPAQPRTRARPAEESRSQETPPPPGCRAQARPRPPQSPARGTAAGPRPCTMRQTAHDCRKPATPRRDAKLHWCIRRQTEGRKQEEHEPCEHTDQPVMDAAQPFSSAWPEPARHSLGPQQASTQ
jgi:hypothetical protein